MNYILIENKIEEFKDIKILGETLSDICSKFGNVIYDKKNIQGEGYTVIIPNNVYFIDNSSIDEVVEYYKMRKFGFTYVSKDSSKLGIYVVDNSIINEDFYKLIGSNTNSCFLSNKFYMFNDFYELSIVEDEIRKIINKKHMINGVRIENQNSVIIGKNVVLESGSYIKEGTSILGDSKIEKGAIVGPYSELLNAYVGENALVRQSVDYDSKVLSGAQVGPFTHLRMNTTIGENDRIGNFVEIKNSTIGRKTNVSHLTYVGDTDCGSGVNFGCGTVTVNYDGKNKFRCKIGDNVFIGCNSNLIAPITLDDGAFIAAGSTITDSLEKDDFAIARCKQVTKKAYAKKFGYKKV